MCSNPQSYTFTARLAKTHIATATMPPMIFVATVGRSAIRITNVKSHRKTRTM